MLCRIQNNPSQPSSLRTSLFRSFYSFFPSYLLEMERYIPSKPFWSFPLSSKVPLISNGMSCLIFQTSRWPFQRNNKVLKMQVLSSYKRQLGCSPVLLHRSHWGACATKKFKVVPPMHRSWKEAHLCQLPLRTLSARVPSLGLSSDEFLHSRAAWVVWVRKSYYFVGFAPHCNNSNRKRR